MAQNYRFIAISFYRNIGCQNRSCDEGLSLKYQASKYFSSISDWQLSSTEVEKLNQKFRNRTGFEPTRVTVLRKEVHESFFETNLTRASGRAYDPRLWGLGLYVGMRWDSLNEKETECH